MLIKNNTSIFERETMERLDAIIKGKYNNIREFSKVSVLHYETLLKSIQGYQHMNVCHLGKIMPHLDNEYQYLFTGEKAIPEGRIVEKAFEMMAEQVGELHTAELMRKMVIDMLDSVELRTVLIGLYLDRRREFGGHTGEINPNPRGLF